MAILDLQYNNTDCPCGSSKFYQQCCAPYHLGKETPKTAEQLMRSRFCAFKIEDVNYLLRTWHVSTRPATLTLDSTVKWQNLNINGRKKGRYKDNEGWVTFVASFQINGVLGTHHETSYFIQDPKLGWCYVEGQLK